MLRVRFFPSIEAVYEARDRSNRLIASDAPERILITGSLHFAGEALANLRGEPAAYEECAQ